jgi:hypothetical protein
MNDYDDLLTADALVLWCAVGCAIWIGVLALGGWL